MPLATETFRLSTAPCIGMRASSSQVLRVSWRMPPPSAPSTSATGPLRSSWYKVPGASSQVPMHQMLRSLSSSSVRARLVPMKYGMVSAAPLATLATVALMPTAWSLGAITACAPAPSATRRQAPRVCGSVTPSSTNNKPAPRPPPGPVGHAQAGPEVVRIGHAVEHQQQGRSAACGLELFQQFVERTDRRHGLHARGHALAAMAAGQLGDAHAVSLDQAGAGRAGAFEKLAHARVAPRGLVVDLDDRVGRGLQTHAHGVKAEQDFGAGHRAIIRWRPMAASCCYRKHSFRRMICLHHGPSAAPITARGPRPS